MAHDLVIRDGIVLDGSGRSRYRADVAVDGGVITNIGRIRDRGREEIDAEGHFVAPGFIDGHVHMDAQVFWDPTGTSDCYHGVTTVIMGNCGFSIAPCRETEKDYVFRSLERAEDISREAMLAGIPWQWEHYPQYLDAVDRLPKGINYAAYIGHTALRTYVMGERAFTETATDDDLQAMQAELSSAIRAGAFGFSSTRSSAHMTADDRPVPSRRADWNEVRALVSVMGDLGAGLFQFDHEKTDPGSARDEYVERVRRLAIDSGRPMFFMLVVPPTEPDFWVHRLELADSVAEQGGRIHPQVHSHDQIIIRNFRTRLPFDQLGRWSQLRRMPLEEQRKGLMDPESRRLLVEEAMYGDYQQSTSRMEGVQKGVTPSHVQVGALAAIQSRPPDFDRIMLLDRPIGPYRSLAEIAKERRTTPVDVMIDLSLESDFEQLFGQRMMNIDLDVVLKILKHPRTILGVSDAGAHNLQSCNSSIPTHLLSYWVREREEFDWEEGIRMLTSEPANVYGFPDRGFVREGFTADLVVFDPLTIAPEIPTLEHDLPTGAPRFKQGASGIASTIVGGQVLLRHGEHTGAYPGRLIRGPLASQSSKVVTS